MAVIVSPTVIASSPLPIWALALLAPPVTGLRLSLHPGGLASAILNLPVRRGHILGRHQHSAQADVAPTVAALHAELMALGGAVAAELAKGIAMPLELATQKGALPSIRTVRVFGTPTEVALAGLAIEAVYPTYTVTAEQLQRLCAG
jgi:hypothetical protein